MQRWDHNNHYHQYLLNQLPPTIDRALDIGCGYGEFAVHLAERTAQVDAVDVSADVVHAARQHHAQQVNLSFVCGDFVELNLPSGHYQAVTSLAALHHMDLGAALEQMKRVLKPGGVLAILGLYREATVGDYVASVAGVLAHAFYSRFIYRDNFLTEPTSAAPVMDSTMTLAEIKAVANGILPGTRIRRHLLWRYSLIWQNP